MECCKNCTCLDLGCFFHNESKDLGIIAEMSGEYVFIFKASFGYHKTTIVFEALDSLKIPVEVELNENMNYTLEIIDPAGVKVSVEGKSCFKFQVLINNTVCDDDTIYYPS